MNNRPASPRMVCSEARRTEEARLVNALSRRDPQAYSELQECYRDSLLAVARRMLRSAEDADDCVQEAMIKVLRNIDRFEGRCGLGTWMHRIVVNEALMILRTRRRRAELSLTRDGDREDGPAITLEPISGPADCPSAILETQQTARLVRDAVAALPESYREILTLRDLEEEQTETVAQTLGISVGNAKVRAHRARAALRRALAPRVPIME